MSVKALALVTKKADMSFDEFIHYFETVHVTMMQRIFADTLPTEFRRIYMDSSKAPAAGPSRGIDLTVVMVFDDEEAYGRFLAKFGEGDHQKTLTDDWYKYADERGETVIRVDQAFGF